MYILIKNQINKCITVVQFINILLYNYTTNVLRNYIKHEIINKTHTRRCIARRYKYINHVSSSTIGLRP